jgi:hypothetical protein
MKRKRTRLTREFWKHNDQMMRRLEERLAYHERKLAEERTGKSS